MEDPLPAWLRDAAGVVDQETAFRFVHAAAGLRPGGARPRAAALRRGVRAAADHGLPARRRRLAPRRAAPPAYRWPAGRLRRPAAVHADPGQVEVSEQIFAELARTFPMQRLLQGEVGSGKTLVALRAMLAVVDAGGQAALLAPTEVLAAQHFSTVTAAARRPGGGRHARGGGERDREWCWSPAPSRRPSAGRRPCGPRPGEAGHRHRDPRPAQRRACSSPTWAWSWSTSSTGSGSSSGPR